MDPKLKAAVHNYLTQKTGASPELANRMVAHIEANPHFRGNQLYIEAAQKMLDEQNAAYTAQQEVNRMGDMNQRGLQQQYGLAAYDPQYVAGTLDRNATPEQRAEATRLNAQYRQEQMTPVFQAPAQAAIQLSRIMDPAAALDVASKLFAPTAQAQQEPAVSGYLKPSAVTRHGHAGD